MEIRSTIFMHCLIFTTNLEKSDDNFWKHDFDLNLFIRLFSQCTCNRGNVRYNIGEGALTCDKDFNFSH